MCKATNVDIFLREKLDFSISQLFYILWQVTAMSFKEFIFCRAGRDFLKGMFTMISRQFG